VNHAALVCSRLRPSRLCEESADFFFHQNKEAFFPSCRDGPSPASRWSPVVHVGVVFPQAVFDVLDVVPSVSQGEVVFVFFFFLFFVMCRVCVDTYKGTFPCRFAAMRFLKGCPLL